MIIISIILIALSLIVFFFIYLNKDNEHYNDLPGLYTVAPRICFFVFGLGLLLFSYYFTDSSRTFIIFSSYFFMFVAIQITLWSIGFDFDFLGNKPSKNVGNQYIYEDEETSYYTRYSEARGNERFEMYMHQQSNQMDSLSLMLGELKKNLDHLINQNHSESYIGFKNNFKKLVIHLLIADGVIQHTVLNKELTKKEIDDLSTKLTGEIDLIVSTIQDMDSLSFGYGNITESEKEREKLITEFLKKVPFFQMKDPELWVNNRPAILKIIDNLK